MPGPSFKLSALPLRSLRLCGASVAANSQRRDAENAEESQRISEKNKEQRTTMGRVTRKVFNICFAWTIALLPLALWTQSSHAQQKKFLEPYELRDDFQGDGLGQWASYPPVQDIGYEPSISPTTQFDAPGGRALMRVVQPPGPGELTLGFIKRVNLVSNDNMKLSFSYRINALTDSKIEIGLAGTDAQRYSATLLAKNNGWSTSEVDATSFHDTNAKALTSGIGIEAIYLVCHISNANPDTTYRFLIDNVVVSATHEADFKVLKPATTRIEPWRSLISNKELSLGDELQIEAQAPVKLTNAECALRSGSSAVTTARLYDDGTHGDRQANDGIWSNAAVYRFSGSDSAGLWKVELRGNSADGRVAITPLRFLVEPPNQTAHPRVFFTAKEREVLIARTTNPKLTALWTKLRERARASRETGDLANGGRTFELLDKNYLLPTLLGYFDVLNRARARISSNSFDAYITGDKESLAAAKRALLDVARWNRWSPPWFTEHGQHTYYPAGELAVDVAFGYDLLYDNLSVDERSLIRKALIEKSIVPTYKEYVLDNRAMANTSNWISHTVSGALIAAAAVSDDCEPTEDAGKLETYINGLLLKLEDHMTASYLPDGSYGEGTSYQEFDLETLGVAIPVIKRVFGIDYYSQSHVKDSFSYSLYTVAQPTSDSLDMGDTHPPSTRTLAPLIARSTDPALRWYFQLFDHSSLIDFIFYDDSVRPEPPALPSSKIFSDKGYASFRTGWKPDDWLFLYRAGPTFNHNHSDQGSFLLTAFGENLVTEAGWSDYYKDPYYDTFFTQAIGHNTVLVDGDPQSQSIADTAQFAALNNHPRITDAITSEFYDAVCSDLTTVYKGRLARYTRRIVFLKPHYLVVYDDLNAKSATTFDWLLHLPDRSAITTQMDAALYTGTKAALAVRVLGSTNSELKVRDGHIPYPVFATNTPKTTPSQPAFLDVRNPAPATSMQFLVGLVPARKGQDAQAVTSAMTRIEAPGLVGLQTNRGSESDLIMFRSAGAIGNSRFKDLETDAAAWSLTQAGDQLRMFAVQSARILTRAGRFLFRSDQPISLAVNYQDEINVSCTANTPAKLTLFVGKSPASIRLNQAELAQSAIRFNRTDETITVDLPRGSHTLLIRVR